MPEVTEILQNALRAANATFEKLRDLAPALSHAADLVTECLLSDHKLLVCGNGGSAADGADFSAEFGCRFVHDRRPYPAMNLAQGGSLTSAISNDYGFDEVFARQVWAFGQPGDVLLAISTSGNSRNILRALEEAKKRGLTSIALLGRDGGPTKGMAGVELIIGGDSTARIQEAHKFLLHVLCEIVDARIPKA
jgi:D-sedoheptulose 7-phosphate isomerase